MKKRKGPSRQYPVPGNGSYSILLLYGTLSSLSGLYHILKPLWKKP